MRRRDILLGGACFAAAGTAYALTPRKHVSLIGKDRLEDIIPPTFGAWTSRDVSDPVALNSEDDSLAAQLYNQLVTRLYVDASTGDSILALFAYGAQQTDALQLHRPEVCYPAFGYEIVQDDVTSVRLDASALVPARLMGVQSPTNSEMIVYWTRVGEALPRSGGQQRSDKLKLAFKGIIADGVLCRFSGASVQFDRDGGKLKRFAAELVTAIDPRKRQVLIGSALASSMRHVPGAGRA